MSTYHTPNINIVVVPKAVSDNFKMIGLKKVITPGYLETILSPRDILFYRFLNSISFQLSSKLGVNSKSPAHNFNNYDLTTIHEQLMSQYGEGKELVGGFEKSMHRLVFEGLPQNNFLFYTLLGMEDNNVVLGVTSDPQDATIVKSVSEFITTFYEHYGLQALARGDNSVYLDRLVTLAI